MRQIQSEFAAAGLAVVSTRAVLWGLSRMWYAVGRGDSTPPGWEWIQDAGLRPLGFSTSRMPSAPADIVSAQCTGGF